jgi:hypothetical protein
METARHSVLRLAWEVMQVHDRCENGILGLSAQKHTPGLHGINGGLIQQLSGKIAKKKTRKN